jgi:hypothetical protein
MRTSSACTPTPEALLRLAGAVLAEAYDEWQVADKRYLSEGSMALLDTPAADPKEVATPALLKARSATPADHHSVKTIDTTRRDVTGHYSEPVSVSTQLDMCACTLPPNRGSRASLQQPPPDAHMPDAGS